jgi:hypothetical protein
MPSLTQVTKAFFTLRKPDDHWRPTDAQWQRWLSWNLRNPFQAVVELYKQPKIDSPTWNPSGGFWFIYRADPPFKDWNQHVLATAIFYGFKRLTFVSYRGKHIEGYVGVRPSGLPGAAFRRANAKNEQGKAP